jgi:transposase
MPRGTKLSEFEKGQIMALHEEGRANKAIARRINRSAKVVRNFISDPTAYGTKKHTGRKRILSPRNERCIRSAASNSFKSCTDIQRENNLNISKTTVWRTLKRTSFITRAKMQPSPKLGAHHKAARLSFARENMKRDWTKVSYLASPNSFVTL